MEPWDLGRRARAKAKIDKEAARAAARLGAEGVVIVAFYPDGDHFHMLDGGKSPMPLKELYKTLLMATEMNEAAPAGKDPGFIQ